MRLLQCRANGADGGVRVKLPLTAQLSRRHAQEARQPVDLVCRQIQQIRVRLNELSLLPIIVSGQSAGFGPDLMSL